MFSCSAVHSETKSSIEKKIESYLNGIKCISAEFVQILSNGEFYKGKFWLSKKNGQNIKIIYTYGINQKILIRDGAVNIYNEKNKKSSCSVSKTPIYAILNDGIDLSKEKYEILENSDKVLSIKLEKSSFIGNTCLTLLFSKYKNTGNIKNIDGWIIGDKKTEILLSFEPETFSANDFKKIPDGVFDYEKSEQRPN